MSFSKILAILIFILCGAVAYFSWGKNHSKKEKAPSEKIVEITSVKDNSAQQKPVSEQAFAHSPSPLEPVVEDKENDGIDLVNYFFKTHSPQLPIVETVVYSSKVDWLKGRPAYLGDYASHFQTSKHFISRSLRGKANYFSQNVSNGDRFNVLNPDKKIQFHLVVDLSRLKMRFYYFDEQKNERVILKTYRISAGKLDPSRSSGSLTPLGKYFLGQEVAIYKEGIMGTYNNQPCEMITVFGNRWIPFEKEIGLCTAPAKGLGIHGMPWKNDAKSGKYIEAREAIGKFESSGCIRLLTEDIEEIFSIIITKPTYIQIVKDFSEADLPGTEIKLDLT